MLENPGSTDRGARLWDAAYMARGAEAVSWFQAEPSVSLELVDELGLRSSAAVVDVGGGASRLADRLLERGFTDLTVLDISEVALAELRSRLGARTPRLVQADLLGWEPDRAYDLWHDRAVLHFLVDGSDRDRYLEALRGAVKPGGAVIVATFAPDGPPTCSGLPVERYSADDLVRILGERFHAIATRRELHTTPRGAIQPFTWVAGRLG